MSALINAGYALALLVLGTLASAVVEQLVQEGRVSARAFATFARSRDVAHDEQAI